MVKHIFFITIKKTLFAYYMIFLICSDIPTTFSK